MTPASKTDAKERMAPTEEDRAVLLAAFENAPVPMLLTSADGAISLVNARACSWLNTPSTELLGRPVGERFSPHDLDRIAASGDGECQVIPSGGPPVAVRLVVRNLPHGGLHISAPATAPGDDRDGIAALNRDLARRVKEFETLLEVLPVGIAVGTDPDCHNIRLNPAFAAMLGIEPTMNASKSGPNAVHLPFRVLGGGGELTGEQMPMQVSARENREIRDVELQIVRSDGSVIEELCFAKPLHDEQQNVRGSIGVFLDITARKKAERDRERFMAELQDAVVAAERSRAQLKAVFEAVQDAVIVFDMAGNVVFVNEAGSAINRFASGGADSLRNLAFFANLLEITGDDGRVIEPADWPAARVLRGESVRDWELRITRRDTGEQWFYNFNGEPVRDASGTQILAVITIRNVRDRKLAEAALRTSEERFRAVVQASTQVVYSADRNGETKDGYHFWEKVTGQPASEAQGFGWLARVHPDDRERAEQVWRRALETREPAYNEYRVQRRDGSYLWIGARAVPLNEPDGKLREWVIAFSDISERKRSHDLLEQSNENLQRANEDLQRFAYAAAHDLQEPLRNITLYAQLVSRRYSAALDQQGCSFLKLVSDASLRMQDLVRDLLAYTQALDLDKPAAVAADPNVALAQVLEHLDVFIREAGASISTSPMPLLAVHPSHLMQLFQNLISNSIKYRRAGIAPDIRITCESASGVCTIRIADNGIGIRPDYHHLVFGVFKRLHGAEIPGTGIGLAICRKIVDFYDGRIWVESEGDHRGATFCLTLPLAAPGA